MDSAQQSFYCLWQEGRIRETLFILLPKEDLAAVRAANTACCNLLTKRLFLRTNVTFTANTFTRPCRVQALSRVGHHIEHLTFNFPHGDATFLPPLIHPLTGHEITFLYTPHTSMGSVLARPKYANSELGDILMAQYPPLFHAATNVPSFINAMKHLPNMRHLTIKTPGQDPRERYRRDIVDYALVSLRISLERAPLLKLNKLTLTSLHPAAFNYLRHIPAIGGRPSAGRRWRQIRKLHISVESWDFYGPSPGRDHLKIIDDYIRAFAPTLEKITFTWLGRKGPCPLALGGDPLFAPPRCSKKLFNEVTSPMSPLPPTPFREQMVLPRARFVQVRNATMNAPQVACFVAAHRDTVREFDFDNVVLTSGSWDEALAPLTENGPDRKSTGSYKGLTSKSEVWARSDNAKSGESAESATSNEELPSPSAAVAAASRELLDEELEKSLLGLVGVEDERREEILQWAAKTPTPNFDGDFELMEPAFDEGEETEREIPARPEAPTPRAAAGNMDEVDNIETPYIGAQAMEGDFLASQVSVAVEASEAVSTNVKKRKVKKRRRRKRSEATSESGYETEKTDKVSRSRSSSKHRREHSTKHPEHKDSSTSLARSRSHRHSYKRDSIPDVPEIPEVIDDDIPASDTVSSVLPPLPLLIRSNTSISTGSNKSQRSFRSFRSFKSLRSRPSISEEEPEMPSTPKLGADISAPILANSDEEPVMLLLQPTIYDPASGATGKVAAIRESIHEITAVQRNIEQEEAHRLLAQDTSAQTSALRKAKEVVLSKLSREFSLQGKEERREREKEKENGAVRRRLLECATRRAGEANGNALATGTGWGAGLAGARGWWGKSTVSVAPSDCRTLDSQSALVPLMFSRS